MNWSPHRFSLHVSIALLHFAWIGASIAVVAFLGNQFLRRSRAATRYLFNLALLFAMLLSFPVILAWQVQSAREPGANPVLAAADLAISPTIGEPIPARGGESDFSGAATEFERVSARRASSSADWSGQPPRGAQPRIRDMLAPWIAGLYGAGVLAMLARLLVAVYGGHRLNRSARRIAEPGVLELVVRQARALGLRVAPVVAFCERLAAPVVVGIVRPTILMPLSVMRALTPEQLRDILTHEMAHIRRCDHLVVVLQRFVEAVGYFHPGVWYVSRRLSRERELCCDDLVIAAGAERLAYAESLCRVAELVGAPALKGKCGALLAADGRKPSHLRQRIVRLLETAPEPAVRWTRSGALGFVALAAIAFVPLLIAPALNPQRQAVIAADDGGKVNSASSASSVVSPAAPEPNGASKGQDGRGGDPAARREAGLKVDGETIVQFTFQDALWSSVIKEIARLSKMSCGWQTLPSDTLNFRSAGRYTVAQARDILNERLMFRGYSMLVDPKSATITVVNLDDLNTALVPRVAREDLDNKELMPHSLVKVSFHLDWIVAEKGAAEFKPLLTPKGKLIPLKTTNRLEAIDAVENVRRLARTLEEADKGPVGGGIVREFELRYTRAAEVLEQVETVLGTKKDNNGPPKNAQEAQAQMMMMQRMMMAQHQPGGQAGHAAGQQQSPQPEAAAERTVRLMANRRRNSILAAGSAYQLAMVNAAIKKLDVPQNSLKDAVAKINQEEAKQVRNLADELRRLEAGGYLRGPNLGKDRYPSPLTEEEVIKAIHVCNADHPAYRILQEVARSRTLPPRGWIEQFQFWLETPVRRAGAAEQQIPGAPSVRVEHLHWSIRLFVMTGERTCEGFVIRDQKLDVARVALPPDPGFEWTMAPFSFDSFPYSTFTARIIVFVEKGLDQGLSVTASFGRHELVPGTTVGPGSDDVRAVAFDKDGRRLVLKPAMAGAAEDVLMQRFRLDPRELPADHVQFVGVETLSRRYRKPIWQR